MRMTREHDLHVLSFEETDYLFGISKKMNANGFLVIEGQLWRYCDETETRWPTGWANTSDVPYQESVPTRPMTYDVIEKHVPARL